MTKSFKSMYRENDHQKLTITGVVDGVHVSVDHDSGGAKGIFISVSDIPALAVAELESSGLVEGSSHLQDAVRSLGYYMEDEAYRVALDKDQAKLKEEALDLFNTGRKTIGHAKINDWEEAPHRMDSWVSVARRARELKG